MSVLIKYFSVRIITTFLFVAVLFLPLETFSQLGTASTANWQYPDGDLNGTKYVGTSSNFQYLDSLVVKWSTGEISGDIKPLIGNIVNNNSIRQGFLAPNEITAVMGDHIVIIDGLGRLVTKTRIPSQIIGINEISTLLDTISLNSGTTKLLGLATREVETPDSIAHAYIAGYNHTSQKVEILKSLAIDLKDYTPNVFASIRPVFGKKSGDDFLVYANINMSQPEADDPFPVAPPFYRGLAMFNIGNFEDLYPLPDNFDDINSRVTLGPEIPLIPPSINANSGDIDILMPLYPSPDLDVQVQNFVTFETAADTPYLLGFDLSTSDVREGVYFDVSPFMEQRPRIKPYFIDITDNNTNEETFILLAEEYSGIDGSQGTSRLHLHETDFGDPLTGPPGDMIEPPLTGGQNHYWSVAVGNLDGNSDNEWLPYYPNNRGKELIVTQSSRDFAVASSRLYVLRYNSGPGVEKPTGANEFLYPLDTICTQRVNGWIAAVNDLDGDGDNKDEIILVDGTNVRILRMRDYNDIQFRLGRPFDTVAVYSFREQTISNVAIADLEGDGKNDIIVSTFDSTYALGTLIDDTIEMLSLLEDDPLQEFCAGDTINLEWRNIIRAQQKVNIKFIPYNNGNPVSGSEISLAEGVNNDADTIFYNFTPDEILYNMTGKIRVESSARPDFIFDETELIRINPPLVYNNPLLQEPYYIGEEFRVSGDVSCIDSIYFEYYHPADSTWNYLGSGVVDNEQYEFIGELPCLNIFRCDSIDTHQFLDLRSIGTKTIVSDTSDVFSIDIEPAKFKFHMELNETADPTKYISWDTTDIRFFIDTLVIAASGDGGVSFRLIDIVDINDQSYQWNVPLDMPSPVILRLCGAGTCVRSDTLLKDYRPKFINMIAPNPFQPPFQEAEIVYKVPEVTNVNMYIIDQNNAIVKEILNNATRYPEIAYTEKWDGFLNNGVYAANGLYYVVIELSNGNREVNPIFLRK